VNVMMLLFWYKNGQILMSAARLTLLKILSGIDWFFENENHQKRRKK